ncbi:hypothetical protein INT47_009406 [Mucor saturninus]|uniref:Uncharacterized protein n=1 Tax=Mucor saturninus TaxID=64648 RepID=A0A8H7R4M7_9FUNG|nr:hypothetical protein INT47_009406 [Mucor saturninus]
MVKPNIAIYPLPFITREKLQKFSSKLKQLEEETDTTIIYDYEDQVFNIEGESQEGCDIVEENILFSLIPLLSNDIDKTCMTGTYEELSFIEGKVPVASFNIVNVEGRSLKDQEDDMEHDEEVIIKKEPEDVQFIIKEFHISPRITNIQAFIIGPPQFNMQLAEYLEIIPRMTNTDCVLLGRCIRITGEESCVDNAIDKFRVIQNSHIAHLEVDYVMCIHYPKHSGPYGLCFCDLNRYKQKEFVIDQLDPHQVLEDIYVMLPVFIDPFTNEYARPKDLIQIKAPAQKKYQQMAEEEYRERDKLKRKEINDAFAMLNVKPVIETKSNQSHKYYVQYSEPHYNTSSPTLTGKIPVDTNSMEFIGSLENHHTASASSSAPIRRPNYVKNNMRDSTKEVLKSESTDEEPLSVYEYEVQKLPENTEEHFPSLSPSPVSRSSTPINGRRPKGLYKPTLGNDEPKKNRVIRIVPQKSYRSRSPTPSLSLVER